MSVDSDARDLPDDSEPCNVLAGPGPCDGIHLPTDDEMGPPLHNFFLKDENRLRMAARRTYGARSVAVGCATARAASAASASSAAAPPVAGLFGAKECCRAQCLATVQGMPEVQAMRDHFRGLDKDDQDQWLFDELKPPASAGVAKEWSLGGQPVCFTAWCNILHVGKYRVKRIREAGKKSDRPVPFADQRVYNQGRDPAALRRADAFLEFAYQNMAEPLADAHVVVDDMMPDGELVLPSSGGSDMEENFVVVPEIANKGTRYLPPGSIADLYDTSSQFERSSPPVSESTFRRALKKWRPTLKFRRTCQHARCSECAKLQKLRREAKTAAERDQYQKDFETHLRGMFMDRAMDARYAKLSEESACGTLVDGTILSIAMDGMDQAKFRCPRNTCNSKDLESLWRPVLHVTGLIAEGIGEYYFIAESDCKKNSDMNCQCLSRVLEHVSRVFASKLLVVPRHLVLLTDNTCREQKNQNAALSSLSWLGATASPR